jgi:zinc transport system substrate-binding protein
MERIRSANSRMQILDARAGLTLRKMEYHEHDHGDSPLYDDHVEHEADPHIWTSPLLVKEMSGKIRNKLVELDPSGKDEYNENHQAFTKELDDLHQQIETMLGSLENRRFLVFHPAWGYFADTYNLVQIPIQHEGKEPGARALAGLIEQAKRQQIKVVFVQPQFDKRQANQVARAINGRVIPVDPLATDYIENLRQVAERFAEALQP